MNQYTTPDDRLADIEAQLIALDNEARALFADPDTGGKLLLTLGDMLDKARQLYEQRSNATKHAAMVKALEKAVDTRIDVTARAAKSAELRVRAAVLYVQTLDHETNTIADIRRAEEGLHQLASALRAQNGAPDATIDAICQRGQEIVDRDYKPLFELAGQPRRVF